MLARAAVGSREMGGQETREKLQGRVTSRAASPGHLCFLTWVVVASDGITYLVSAQ